MTKSSFQPFDYLSGSVVPQLVLYLPADFEKNQLATICLPAIAQQPKDYAKIALERLRYLKKAYASPHQPDGVSPNAEAFRDAEVFILKLPLNKTGVPTINIASDGEVNFDWSDDASRIDLGFFGDGHYSFYARGRDIEATGDNIAIVEEIPASLLQIASTTP